jgi:hypothetical protein
MAVVARQHLADLPGSASGVAVDNRTPDPDLGQDLATGCLPQPAPRPACTSKETLTFLMYASQAAAGGTPRPDAPARPRPPAPARARPGRKGQPLSAL